MDKEDITGLADLLEQAGYEDAIGLIEIVLLPKAIREKLSLREAMDKHANSGGSQDSSSYMLHIALTQVSITGLVKLNIDDVVETAPS